MKKAILLIIVLFHSFILQAQVLNVKKTQQEHDQWCWAATSKCVLDYYGFVKKQCEIAEWTRKNATFYNFGSTNCCTDPGKGCNYWNYNYGEKGSIQEILVQFGNLENKGVAKALTQAEVVTEMQKNRLFVIRWGWSGGGGHFLVGHGIKGNDMYYMDPWFGEGMKIGTYSYVKSGPGGSGNSSNVTHTWTHTNQITSSVPTSLADGKSLPALTLYPNPARELVTIEGLVQDQTAKVELLDMLGKIHFAKEIPAGTGTSSIATGGFDKGLYILRVFTGNRSIEKKLIIQ